MTQLQRGHGGSVTKAAEISRVATVAILALIQNALNLLNVSPYFTQLVQGLVIFTAVAIDMNRRGRK